MRDIIAQFFARRSKRWREFLMAEAIATPTMLITALVVYLITNSQMSMSFLASIAETIPFYIVLGRIEYIKNRRPAITLRNMFCDFGPSEIADTLLIRPLAMYACGSGIGGASIAGVLFGMLVGKFLADVPFCLIAHCSFALRTKMFSA